MFRKSKVDQIGEFFASPLQINELAVFYLDISGSIMRSSNHAVPIDPAEMSKNEELNELKGLSLVLFTHEHLDHFSLGKTRDVFNATAAPVLAEPKVA